MMSEEKNHDNMKEEGEEATKLPFQQPSLDLLCKEFTSMYADELVAVSEPLNELTRNQDVLLETMQQENARFSEVNERLALDQMFAKVTHYQGKLANIKKDMVALHDKVAKLKKRAVKLQQIREKQT